MAYTDYVQGVNVYNFSRGVKIYSIKIILSSTGACLLVKEPDMEYATPHWVGDLFLYESRQMKMVTLMTKLDS